MRQNPQQIEVASRAHHFRGFVQKLNFAGSVGDAALFFVSRCRRENDVREFRRLRQKHFVNDQQFELAAPGSKRAKMRQRIRTHYVERFQLSILRCIHHGRRRQPRFRGNHSAPEPFEPFSRRRIVRVRVPGQTVRQQPHIGRSARIRVVPQRHVANLAVQL